MFLTYSKEKRIDFFKRCFIPTKRGLVCILISLLLVCSQSAVAQLISRIFFNAEPLGFEGLKLIISAPYMFFYFLFWGLISGPLSEEFGWRGFLQDSMLKKHSVVVLSIIVGLVWGIWHLPLFFYPAQIQHTWLNTNVLLAVGFILNCVSNAFVYSAIHILSLIRLNAK